MRSKNTYLRLQRFRVEERRRQVQAIEAMLADFRRKQDDLDHQIAAEEQRNGVTDPGHFSYSMTAKSLRGRRANIQRSMSELKAELDEAKERFAAEESELRKLELLAEKEGGVVQVAAPAEAGDDTSRWRNSLS
ncbi:MAG: flagellar export protein FliJ [Aestuariivirgaceae bacterium]|jgi:flagellar protein FliJ